MGEFNSTDQHEPSPLNKINVHFSHNPKTLKKNGYSKYSDSDCDSGSDGYSDGDGDGDIGLDGDGDRCHVTFEG